MKGYRVATLTEYWWEATSPWRVIYINLQIYFDLKIPFLKKSLGMGRNINVYDHTALYVTAKKQWEKKCSEMQDQWNKSWRIDKMESQVDIQLMI